MWQRSILCGRQSAVYISSPPTIKLTQMSSCCPKQGQAFCSGSVTCFDPTADERCCGNTVCSAGLSCASGGYVNYKSSSAHLSDHTETRVLGHRLHPCRQCSRLLSKSPRVQHQTLQLLWYPRLRPATPMKHRYSPCSVPPYRKAYKMTAPVRASSRPLTRPTRHLHGILQCHLPRKASSLP